MSYEEIVSMENLLEAWQEFIKGKRSRQDVQVYERALMENLFNLHDNLANLSYKHGSYSAFTISDPKTRQIHKAMVADRILHRAIYRKLYPFFDRQFIADSFSCRIGKGSHKALDRFAVFSRKVTKNYRKTGWVLKCDIRKFFAFVDQQVLVRILNPYIVDKRIICLIEEILTSFQTTENIGLPLGNLTSQLFSNVYMNVFDHFVKYTLQMKYYIRYADDFVLMLHDSKYLLQPLPLLRDFLKRELCLNIHPDKIEMKTIASGVDYLGWVHFPHHRVLRTTTKRRMLNSLGRLSSVQIVVSYKGLLKHGKTFKILQLIDTLEQNRDLRYIFCANERTGES